ncbi:WD40 repeat-like protein [Durotheca rogersii]|uniref:WD40 repeat-like protein n=1 Tax=Durotheca rogersii TaxID=419775 RepID=UPI002220ADB9|nr:WD40 repeat-like protein [Durotheca rogersii]KAI5860096.1 WD40 repeat-like protein [Durotheca rogersii]
MNRSLFERSSGSLSPGGFARLVTSRLLNTFQAAPGLRFDGGETGTAIRHEEDGPVAEADAASSLWAHQTGVSALALEHFDGRILASGGLDATIKLWNLEQCANPSTGHTYTPVVSIRRSEQTHRFGITHLSFYPFDSGAFLSTSYDETLKVWATKTASLAASFSLGSKVYTHAISPIASHLLVACGTQHPAVRLVDLRSGANVQSLAGHAGAVLAVSWSPRYEHVLASGSVDGTVKIWDIRRAGGPIGMLDQEDSLGLYYNGLLDASTAKVRVRASAKAHTAPVNALTWTDDGGYIVSAGHDQRIRVWDAATGRNTLASFGPSIRNRQLASITPFTSPTGLARPGGELLFWPNETEILVLDLHDGHVVTRLRPTAPAVASLRSSSSSTRSVRNRVTSLAWRGAGAGASETSSVGGAVMGGSNMAGAIFSAHLDGQIRAWVPRLEGDEDEDEDEDGDDEASRERAAKRKALDDVYRGLTGRRITFV